MLSSTQQEECQNSAFNLMRRMPPSNILKSLSGQIEQCPPISEDLLANIDQPLQVFKDQITGKDYIICDYNRDGNAYRSPYSDEYFTEDGQKTTGFSISKELRDMEIEANYIFQIYAKQYFNTALSSVYFFQVSQNDIGAAFLIHKEVNATNNNLQRGVWDSTHIFSVTQKSKNNYEYTLTSSVIISMNVYEKNTGDVDLSGTLTQQIVQERKINSDNTHITNMGRMIEAMEMSIGNKLEGRLYIYMIN